MTVTKKGLARRQFLRGAATAAGALAAMPAMQGLSLVGANGRVSAAKGFGGYGPLVPTPDLRDGVSRLALPEGFQYRSFSLAGDLMADGNRVPLGHDGMGVFNMPDGSFRLVRNHEDRNSPGNGSTALVAGLSYDPLGGGGTTTLIVNPFTRELVRDFVSLSGTTVNCAGGVTPWGSWVTCEETNAGPASGWAKQHGYCFDVPASAEAQVFAEPLIEMGRFSHEAVAIDPATGVVYETEDNGNTSGFYRFVPNTIGVLANGGRLEMLAVSGQPGYRTFDAHEIGAQFETSWAPIANPNPAGTSSTAVFNQGLAGGGARFGRLEGCWYGNGAIYFASTSGGAVGRGQVWEFRPDGDGGTLTLIYESKSAAVLDSPDNLTVSPQGALLLCEDGSGGNFLRGVTLDGQIFDFAENVVDNFEFAGAAFGEAESSWNDVRIRGDHEPLGGRWDRVTLFVNTQGSTGGPNPPSPGGEGMTYAIWGPWKEGAL